MKNKNMCTLEELNLQAAMLKGKGDLEGVIRVAEANGLTVRTAERYLMDEEPALTTQKELAIGRLLLESVDLDLRQSVVLTMIQDIQNGQQEKRSRNIILKRHQPIWLLQIHTLIFRTFRKENHMNKR